MESWHQDRRPAYKGIPWPKLGKRNEDEEFVHNPIVKHVGRRTKPIRAPNLRDAKLGASFQDDIWGVGAPLRELEEQARLREKSRLGNHVQDADRPNGKAEGQDISHHAEGNGQSAQGNIIFTMPSWLPDVQQGLKRQTAGGTPPSPAQQLMQTVINKPSGPEPPNVSYKAETMLAGPQISKGASFNFSSPFSGSEDKSLVTFENSGQKSSPSQSPEQRSSLQTVNGDLPQQLVVTTHRTVAGDTLKSDQGEAPFKPVHLDRAKDVSSLTMSPFLVSMDTDPSIKSALSPSLVSTETDPSIKSVHHRRKGTKKGRALAKHLLHQSAIRRRGKIFYVSIKETVRQPDGTHTLRNNTGQNNEGQKKSGSLDKLNNSPASQARSPSFKSMESGESASFDEWQSVVIEVTAAQNPLCVRWIEVPRTRWRHLHLSPSIPRMDTYEKRALGKFLESQLAINFQSTKEDRQHTQGVKTDKGIEFEKRYEHCNKPPRRGRCAYGVYRYQHLKIGIADSESFDFTIAFNSHPMITLSSVAESFGSSRKSQKEMQEEEDLARMSSAPVKVVYQTHLIQKALALQGAKVFTVAVYKRQHPRRLHAPTIVLHAYDCTKHFESEELEIKPKDWSFLKYGSLEDLSFENKQSLVKKIVRSLAFRYLEGKLHLQFGNKHTDYCQQNSTRLESDDSAEKRAGYQGRTGRFHLRPGLSSQISRFGGSQFDMSPDMNESRQRISAKWKGVINRILKAAKAVNTVHILAYGTGIHNNSEEFQQSSTREEVISAVFKIMGDLTEEELEQGVITQRLLKMSGPAAIRRNRLKQLVQINPDCRTPVEVTCILQLLEETRFFIQNLSSLSISGKRRLAKHAVMKEYGSYEYVFRQDATPDGYYIILSGSVEILLTSKDGETRRVHFLSDGEGFGERALDEENGKRSAGVMTTTPCEMLFIDAYTYVMVLGDKYLVEQSYKHDLLSTLLPEIPVESLARLCGSARFRRLKPEVLICRQGDHRQHFCMVHTGEVRVLKQVQVKKPDFAANAALMLLKIGSGNKGRLSPKQQETSEQRWRMGLDSVRQKFKMENRGVLEFEHILHKHDFFGIDARPHIYENKADLKEGYFGTHELSFVTLTNTVILEVPLEQMYREGHVKLFRLLVKKTQRSYPHFYKDSAKYNELLDELEGWEFERKEIVEDIMTARDMSYGVKSFRDSFKPQDRGNPPQSRPNSQMRAPKQSLIHSAPNSRPSTPLNPKNHGSPRRPATSHTCRRQDYDGSRRASMLRTVGKQKLKGGGKQGVHQVKVPLRRHSSANEMLARKRDKEKMNYESIQSPSTPQFRRRRIQSASQQRNYWPSSEMNSTVENTGQRASSATPHLRRRRTLSASNHRSRQNSEMETPEGKVKSFAPRPRTPFNSRSTLMKSASPQQNHDQRITYLATPRYKPSTPVTKKEEGMNFGYTNRSNVTRKKADDTAVVGELAWQKLLESKILKEETGAVKVFAHSPVSNLQPQIYLDVQKVQEADILGKVFYNQNPALLNTTLVQIKQPLSNWETEQTMQISSKEVETRMRHLHQSGPASQYGAEKEIHSSNSDEHQETDKLDNKGTYQRLSAEKGWGRKSYSSSNREISNQTPVRPKSADATLSRQRNRKQRKLVMVGGGNPL